MSLQNYIISISLADFQFFKLIDLLVVLKILDFTFHFFNDDGQFAKDIINTNIFVLVLRVSHNTSRQVFRNNRFDGRMLISRQQNTADNCSILLWIDSFIFIDLENRNGRRIVRNTIEVNEIGKVGCVEFFSMLFINQQGKKIDEPYSLLS